MTNAAAEAATTSHSRDTFDCTLCNVNPCLVGSGLNAAVPDNARNWFSFDSREEAEVFFAGDECPSTFAIVGGAVEDRFPRKLRCGWPSAHDQSTYDILDDEIYNRLRVRGTGVCDACLEDLIATERIHYAGGGAPEDAFEVPCVTQCCHTLYTDREKAEEECKIVIGTPKQFCNPLPPTRRVLTPEERDLYLRGKEEYTAKEKRDVSKLMEGLLAWAEKQENTDSSSSSSSSSSSRSRSANKNAFPTTADNGEKTMSPAAAYYAGLRNRTEAEEEVGEEEDGNVVLREEIHTDRYYVYDYRAYRLGECVTMYAFREPNTRETRRLYGRYCDDCLNKYVQEGRLIRIGD